jgi:hypothetical protein
VLVPWLDFEVVCDGDAVGVSLILLFCILGLRIGFSSISDLIDGDGKDGNNDNDDGKDFLDTP